MIKNVPVQLIKFVLKQKMVNEFRTFLMLKLNAKSGVVEINSKREFLVIRKLNISTRTYKRHLVKLKAMYWLGKNEKKLFLRSWSFIQQLLTNEKFTKKVEVCENFLSKEKFRGYLMGAIMSYQCRLLDYLNREERNIGRSIQSRNIPHPLSLNYLSSLLKMPKTTIVDLKKQAIAYGFIHRNKNIVKTNTWLKNQELNMYRRYFSAKSYPILIKGRVYLIESDTYNSMLIFKRFRK